MSVRRALGVAVRNGHRDLERSPLLPRQNHLGLLGHLLVGLRDGIAHTEGTICLRASPLHAGEGTLERHDIRFGHVPIEDRLVVHLADDHLPCNRDLEVRVDVTFLVLNCDAVAIILIVLEKLNVLFDVRPEASFVRVAVLDLDGHLDTTRHAWGTGKRTRGSCWVGRVSRATDTSSAVPERSGHMCPPTRETSR